MKKDYDEIDFFAKFNEQEELDVDAFIRETTYVIWDLKLIGAIYNCYTDDTVIHTFSGGEIHGADQIVADTMSQITAFPDLKIVIHDVIWSGNAVDGYRTSMPWSNIGTNSGVSKYGPPTGKKLTAENNVGIANCIIKRIDGRWCYVEEITLDDEEALRTACTLDE